ncbi:short-chain dehydrogenase [Stenotrophomonas maltophilia]|uniref:SDR family oxidoreductase n=1 Tax=Stenotrophomonas geniculata TaxID=86188 RepID=A0AAP5FAT1_9GAMM|nr:SDR family oxidoreductase [Stenotrophomonas geniculata]MBH1448723.1 SDR family oxidoreductase [Stenotrophomonas maltophilia]MDP4309054.1 SDR family oxidoreductase [Stenotrophomonas geniculata]MDQ7952437.1 SDR family oxidoreductase [Stenotrophomonas geniculata]PJL66353.1 short-chain dehydrogenase [Stenotrophomonas maltophilia]RRU04759.1 SDR family oxidoreductase [Stenotrophomonas maltophilia]
MKKVLIIGATSAIAVAVARRLSARAAAFHLVGRSEERLMDLAADLSVRGAHAVTISVLNVADLSAHEAMIETATRNLGGLDIVLIAHGTLPAQATCDTDTAYALQEFHINGTATIALSNRLAPMLTPGSTLAVISSVAGDRGRASNYLYGSAKAAVSAYLSGLSQRLFKAGINVLTIKPGFVDTPMTASFKKGAMWATPDQVAAGILTAIDKRRSMAYLPSFWYVIMKIIVNIPEFVFRRIRL